MEYLGKACPMQSYRLGRGRPLLAGSGSTLMRPRPDLGRQGLGTGGQPSAQAANWKSRPGAGCRNGRIFGALASVHRAKLFRWVASAETSGDSLGLILVFSSLAISLRLLVDFVRKHLDCAAVVISLNTLLIGACADDSDHLIRRIRGLDGCHAPLSITSLRIHESLWELPLRYHTKHCTHPLRLLDYRRQSTEVLLDLPNWRTGSLDFNCKHRASLPLAFWVYMALPDRQVNSSPFPNADARDSTRNELAERLLAAQGKIVVEVGMNEIA